MSENIQVDFGRTVLALMQDAKDHKVSASNAEEARHWAVVYTDLEHIAAYVHIYLSSEEK